jgi:hypothetical protein
MRRATTFASETAAAVALVAAVITSSSGVGQLARESPAPVRVAPGDLVGMWATVSGDCDQGEHFFSANGKCKVLCFDSYSEGEWSLHDGNKIVIRYNLKTNDREIITVVRIERYSDHIDLEVRYEDGRREKWTK